MTPLFSRHDHHENTTATKITKVRGYRFAFVALLLASAVGALGCGNAATEVVQTETVVPVTTAPAAMGSIRAVIHATGDVNPGPGAELIVTAPQAARIAEITKAEGDRVRRGDVLVRFEIPDLNAAVQSKGAEATAAEARVRVARQNQVRLQDLFNRGVASRKEVDDADKELADAQSALSQAQAGRGSAQQLASRSTVVATFNGVIAKRNHNPGDLVDASTTDFVLRVIDPARLQVDASVPIPDLSRITIGASARVVVGENQEPIAMKVASRPAAVEAGTASAPVRLTFLSPPSLAVGTPVQVEIDAEEHTNVVLVPAQAIVREAEETAVFVAAGNKAQRRAVVLGIVDKDHTEIKSGIKAGEEVIVTGQAGLPDGASISTEKPAAAAEKPKIEESNDKKSPPGGKN
jgi:membrane fusion protein, multidrug efflux system